MSMPKADPNDSLLRHFNAPMTPRQRGAIRSYLGGIDPPTALHKSGGASIAISMLAMAYKTGMLSTTKLPPDCFCDRYNDKGKADLRTVAKEYADGVSMAELVSNAKARAASVKILTRPSTMMKEKAEEREGALFKETLTVKRVRGTL